MSGVRAIIVDDEPLARDKIVMHLRDEPEIEVVTECGDGQEAVQAIRKFAPDLVFLDVQMPVLDGFGVLQALADDAVPAVIFVTAFDKYAIKAFEVHALDYLLKPFDAQRFQNALRRVKAYLMKDNSQQLHEKLLTLLQTLPTNTNDRTDTKYLDRLVVKSQGRIFFLKTEEIEWIEAAGNYVRLHVEGKSHLVRETMARLEEKLDPAKFTRVHRSFMVRLDSVRDFQPWFNGDFVLTLRTGQQITSGRSYRKKLTELLSN